MDARIKQLKGLDPEEIARRDRALRTEGQKMSYEDVSPDRAQKLERGEADTRPFRAEQYKFMALLIGELLFCCLPEQKTDRSSPAGGVLGIVALMMAIGGGGLWWFVFREGARYAVSGLTHRLVCAPELTLLDTQEFAADHPSATAAATEALYGVGTVHGEL